MMNLTQIEEQTDLWWFIITDHELFLERSQWGFYVMIIKYNLKK